MSLAPTGGFPTPGPPRQSSIYFCCCCCSVTQLCLALCDPMDSSTPGFLVLHHPLSLLMAMESVISSNHLILCRPLLLLPSIFSNELAIRIRWPQYWSFSISPSKKYSGLISFRMDWLDLLAVQGTPMSFLQHHNSKASILQHSAFFRTRLEKP